jgi:hypothetical protein
MIAQSEDAAQDWLISYLKSASPELDLGPVLRFTLPDAGSGFPLVLMNRSTGVFAGSSGYRSESDVSAPNESAIWAILRQILITEAIPGWKIIWSHLLQPFLRLIDQYLIAFVTGPRRVVSRYRKTEDFAVAFANEYFNHTGVPRLLIGHVASGLLVKAYVSHQASSSVDQWDGVTFDTPYFEHSPICELGKLPERKGYFLRNFV